mmetsp:Transcript_34863/g.59222  ORF Transcript_34863/g.59222 Transcript_34863/m.59222 type:complete len:256 (+) Transcript_34863:293-1060(+)
MTLPFYMKNRNMSDLQELEANVVMTLAHKFEPLFFGTLADGGSIEAPASLSFCSYDDNDDRAPISDNGTSSDDDGRIIVAKKRPPVRKATRAVRAVRAARRTQSKPPSSSCSLPTADDPIDPSFLTWLYTPRDEGNINPVHLVVRREFLEVRRTMSGRVLFQCACCKHIERSKRSKLSTLAPQNVDNLYRSVVRFMMVHVPACEHMPRNLKELSPKASRVVNERGTKKYWVKSAEEIGLRNGADGRSIVYCPPAK